jgi:hypothetical protein
MSQWLVAGPSSLYSFISLLLSFFIPKAYTLHQTLSTRHADKWESFLTILDSYPQSYPQGRPHGSPFVKLI